MSINTISIIWKNYRFWR